MLTVGIKKDSECKNVSRVDMNQSQCQLNCSKATYKSTLAVYEKVISFSQFNVDPSFCLRLFKTFFLFLIHHYIFLAIAQWFIFVVKTCIKGLFFFKSGLFEPFWWWKRLAKILSFRKIYIVPFGVLSAFRYLTISDKNQIELVHVFLQCINFLTEDTSEELHADVNDSVVNKLPFFYNSNE